MFLQRQLAGVQSWFIAFVRQTERKPPRCNTYKELSGEAILESLKSFGITTSASADFKQLKPL
jgi:hypothetical protein